MADLPPTAAPAEGTRASAPVCPDYVAVAVGAAFGGLLGNQVAHANR
jgi:hypothetical protein